MATIISLKRRIKAAQNVSKTTRAMQMISASKLKNAQNTVTTTRPYVQKLVEMTNKVVGKMENGLFTHSYVKEDNKDKRTLMIVIAPDKGLCGGLVSNLIKKVTQYEKSGNFETDYIVVGKKLESIMGRISKNVVASFPFGTITPKFEAIFPILEIIDEYYLGGRVGRVKVMYTDFESFFSQKTTINNLLPIGLEQLSEGGSNSINYIFEPNAEEILPTMIRHKLEMELYRYLLESFASEQASRMLTMQNATNNARDIIEDLNLEYNKTRQAKITSELLDITGGAMA